MSALSTSSLLVLLILCCLAPAAWSGWRSMAQLSDLLGAPSEMSKEALKSESVQEAAQFAVQQLNLDSSSATPHLLVKVISGTSQVVAGVRYKLVLAIGRSSSCLKNSDGTVSPSNCQADQGTVRKWFADVWRKPTNPAQYELEDLYLY